MATEGELSEIEHAFIASWDRMERYFVSHSSFDEWVRVKPVLELIKDGRKRGYDRQFRADQSYWRCVLSRSRQHGLRDEQARLVFEFHWDGGMLVSYFESTALTAYLNTEHTAITPEVDDLLKRLMAQPIN